MKMSFAKNMEDDSGIKALMSYIMFLNEKYGETAFIYFSRADTRILNDYVGSQGKEQLAGTGIWSVLH